MCTVTYIPLKKGFVLTSSRDEKVHRPTLKPNVYSHSNTLLVYPKDEIANGSWVAASNQKKLACLLNGAFQNHKKKENYLVSRGQILLQCFDFKTFEEAIEMLDLSDVEPFTLLLINYESEIKFSQLIWDGEQKHIKNLNTDKPKIWSSATLYSMQDRELREHWFNKWLIKNNSIEDNNIFDFHTVKQGNDDSNNLLMKRENGLQTVSISQIRIKNLEESFLYFDFKDRNTTTLNLSELQCIQA